MKALILLLAIGIALPLQAARTFNGSSQYIEASTAPRSSTPITISAWFRPTSVASFVVIAATASNSAHNMFRLSLRGDQVGDPIEFVTINGSFPLATAGTVVANVWQHACGVSASTSSRVAYLNGVAGTADSNTVADPTCNRFEIGTTNNAGSYGSYFPGDIAEVAVWSAALTAAEVASLAKGASPMLVRPSALMFYAPLIRNVVDVRSSTALGGPGTTAGLDHPRIYR